MANVALVTADTGNAAATNTKADLEAESHVVTLVADSVIGSTNFDAYDVIVCVRLSGTSTQVSGSVATALDTLWNTGKPMVAGLLGAGMTAGTARKVLTDNIGVTGGDGNGSWTVVANSAGHTEVDVVNDSHPIMAGQSLGALAIYGTANIRISLGSGRSSVGTELLEEDPNAGDLSAWFAVESGDTLLDATTAPARLVYGDIPYGGQGSLNAAGEGLLSAAVNWAANVASGITASGALASQAATVAGAATRTVKASGSLNAGAAAIDGAAMRALFAQGVLASQAAVVVGEGGGQTGITYLGSASNGSTDGSDPVIDLSGLGLQEGDIVYVAGYATNGFSLGAAVLTAGYTTVDSFSSNTTIVARKAMGETPDSSVTCEGRSSATFGTSYVALGFRGVSTTTPEDVTSVMNDTSLDPPSIDPVTDDCMVVAFGIGNHASNVITAGPSGYDDFVVRSDAGSSSGANVAAAHKLLTGHSAEDPGAFTGTMSSSRSATFALRPVSTGPTASGSLQAAAAAISGAASRTAKASGTPQAQASAVDGSATRTAKAAGSVESGPAAIDGTAAGSAQRAVGVLVSGSAVIDGAADKAATASGALQSGAASVVGSVTRTAKTVAAALMSGAARVRGLILRRWHTVPSPGETWRDSDAGETDTWYNDTPGGGETWH